MSSTIVETYRGGQINHYVGPIYHQGGTVEQIDAYSASYLCRRDTKPYQAITARGFYDSVEAARAGIDAAEEEQEKHLRKFDALDYVSARRHGVGCRWPRPLFWPSTDDVATVVHVGKNYVLSVAADPTAVYLSMGNADWQYVCQSGEIVEWADRFEQPIKTPDTCHYCGMPAVATVGFFGEPVCRECGG